MNIYLDIDGVILANDRDPTRQVKEFLEFVVNKYPFAKNYPKFS